ncbi:MAG TPA: hypothetical protein VN445_00100 [Rectinemataceae bacterium]|nr:hypothetical protein [Rectinemataceae bacterium]
MLPDPNRFLDGVNLVTGPGKACGKTTFAKAAAISLRNSGHGFAMISVGIEGVGATARGLAPGRVVGKAGTSTDGPSHDSIMAIAPGEVFITASGFFKAASCLPEILDVLPGETAFGRLVIARAARSGRVVLAGPDRNDHLRWAVERIIGEGWATTIIIDGALNRITQVASLDSAKLFFTLNVNAANRRAMAGKMRYLHRRLSLPLFLGEGKRPRHDVSVFRVSGPMTAALLDRVPAETKIIVVEDFSKIFLDERELTALMRKYDLRVAFSVKFGGFSVTLRSVAREDFERILGEELSEYVISWDAYADQNAKDIGHEK